MSNLADTHYGKAVIYARVSSKEQEQGGYSIPAQIKLLRGFAQSKHLNVVREYKEAESAKDSGRTKFNEMLQFLSTNSDVRTLLCEKTDRLSRNFTDIGTLDTLMKKSGLVIHLVKENTQLSRDSRSQATFMWGIKAVMAKNYSDNLSEEVIKGMDQKASEGKWPTKPPLGYRRNVTTKLVDIDPEKGPLVRRLFEEYAVGNISLRQLTKFADRIGLRSVNGKKLNKAAVHRILLNVFYTGKFIYKGKMYQDAAHEALVSPELFGKVGGLLRRPAISRTSKRNFAYRGLVKCHRCGCSMTPDMKQHRYVYYRCTEWKGRCKNAVSEAKLAEQFAEAVRQVQIDPEMAEKLAVALHESHEDKVEFRENVLRSLERRRKELNGRLDHAYEDKLDGNITEGFWKRKSAEWNDELISIEAEMQSHREANQNYLELGDMIIELARSAYDLYRSQTDVERRKLLEFLVSKTTYADGTLYVTYRKPFDLLVKGPETIKSGVDETRTRGLLRDRQAF